MAYLTYEIVRHDGGWAYKLGDTLSETFSAREDALTSAKSAASRQKVGDGDATVQGTTSGRSATEQSETP